MPMLHQDLQPLARNLGEVLSWIWTHKGDTTKPLECRIYGFWKTAIKWGGTKHGKGKEHAFFTINKKIM